MIVEEHVTRRLLRGHFTEIDRRGFTVFGAQHHKPAAAEVTGLRVRNRQRVANRDRRVDGIAALAQNLHADSRGGGIHRGHHALLGADGMKHIFFHAVGDGRRRRRGYGAKTAS